MSLPVLFIGGMDSSGGAGLLRDAATALALAAPYRTAVTAVTAQSDRQVCDTLAMPPSLVASQAALAVQEGVGAIKIGMLANADIINAVVDLLPRVPVVVDPVLKSTSGHDLLDPPGLEALLAVLLARTSLLTPNLPELQAIATHLGLGSAKEQTVAHALLRRGCAAVLVKGGHAGDPAVCEDRLYRADLPRVDFRGPRIGGQLRGTGCQLASAIAIALARNVPIDTAIHLAKTQVTQRFQLALPSQPARA